MTWTPQSPTGTLFSKESVTSTALYKLRSGMLYNESGRTYNATEQVTPKTLYNGILAVNYGTTQPIGTKWTTT